MNDSFPVVFTLDELWLLHAVVRHEAAIPWQGKWPTTSVELNDTICSAIFLCEDQKLTEATLILSRGDCFLMDATVPQDAKSAGGVLLGKSILMKTFKVRERIAGALEADAIEPKVLSADEIHEAMERFKELPPKRRRRKE